MTSQAPELPQTHRGLLLTSTSTPPTVETLPTPQPGPGSIVVRILAAPIISYSREVLNGTRGYPFPMPLIPGSSAIARVAAIGPDTTSLTPGDLVYTDCFIRARDDPTVSALIGVHEGFTPGSKRLLHGEWRDASFAEYAKVALENVVPLDERRLLGPKGAGGFGYTTEQLTYIGMLLVPYGGLRDIALQPGETVVIAPATGGFGGAAVLVALAMGARVVAMGRNADVLAKLAALGRGRVSTVRISGDVATDVAELQKHGPLDAFLDISPPEARATTHIKSGILALRHSGRVSLMGGIRDDVAIPHGRIMHADIQLKGKWMYNREDMPALVKLVELGLLRLGEEDGVKVIGAFSLEEWEKALDVAAENATVGMITVFTP